MTGLFSKGKQAHISSLPVNAGIFIWRNYEMKMPSKKLLNHLL
jgi:hypothetical protein